MNMNIQTIGSVSASANLPVKDASQLPNLADGDVISAEVVQLEDGKVTLQLPNGGTITAEQRSAANLRQGDQVLLTVRQGEGESVPKLQLLNVNGQPMRAEVTASEYALMRMDVSPNRGNLAIAASLSEMGQAVRPEVFSRMGEILARFPELPPEQSLLLAASSLPLDGDTVQAFAQFMQTPAHAQEFASMLSSLPAQSPEAAALLETAAQQVQAELPAAPVPAAPVPAAAISTGPSGGAAENTSAPAAAQPQPQAFAALPENLSPSVANLLESSGVWREYSEALPKMPTQQAQAHILQLLSDLPPHATSNDRTAIYNALRSMTALPDTGNKAPAAPAGGAAPAPALPEAAPDAAAPKMPAALPQFLSDLFAALDDLPTGERGPALQAAAVRLESKVRAFTNAIEAADGQKSTHLKPVLETGQTLATQLQLGSELGNLIYMQLPITLQNTRQDADLYVLKRGGRSARVDESNATVAICLETENLGQVDTVLQVERDELSLQFRVESREIRQFIQPRLERLARLPFPARYRFRHASVILRDSPITPANAGKVLQSAFGGQAQGGLDISV